MRAVIFCNGSLWQQDYERRLIHADDMIFCANGGSRHAFALGLIPDRVIGDEDSLPDAVKAWLVAQQVEFDRSPAAKDETDSELALTTAIAAGAHEVMFLGATGTRFDHSFANVSLLMAARRAGVTAEVVAGYQHCRLIWDEDIRIPGEVGQTLSLLPWGTDAIGVSAEGVRWPLKNETLHFGRARGVSNELISSEAWVQVQQGVLLVVHHRGPAE